MPGPWDSSRSIIPLAVMSPLTALAVAGELAALAREVAQRSRHSDPAPRLRVPRQRPPRRGRSRKRRRTRRVRRRRRGPRCHVPELGIVRRPAPGRFRPPERRRSRNARRPLPARVPPCRRPRSRRSPRLPWPHHDVADEPLLGGVGGKGQEHDEAENHDGDSQQWPRVDPRAGVRSSSCLSGAPAGDRQVYGDHDEIHEGTHGQGDQ